MPAHRKQLEILRAKYDVQLQHWKQEAVRGNGYQKYIILFDRHLDAAAKEKELLLRE